MKPSSCAVSSLPYKGGRKRIFIGLLCVTCVAVCLVLFIGLILPWLVHDPGKLRYFSITVGCVGIIGFVWICLSLIFHIYTGKNLPGIGSIRHIMIRILLPMMEIGGKYLGINKSTVRCSFIKVNNEFVIANAKKLPPQKLLLLLPHCIQSSKCSRRLVFDMENCINCGQCQIGFLRQLAKKYQFRIAVATGGTIARRIVAEFRPEAIVAVACERDLTSGIQDCYPIPVFGVLNQRPFGPCRDTLAPVSGLNASLGIFLDINEVDTLASDRGLDKQAE